MRQLRFAIGGLIAVVLVPAIGFVALKNPDATWAGVMLLLTCGVLGLAVIGAVCRRETERAWWLGFALFGGGYMILAFWPSEQSPRLPTLPLLEVLGPAFGISPRYVPPGIRGGGGGLEPSFTQIGHCLWALGVAILGGLLAVALFGFPSRPTESPVPIAPPSGQPSRTLRLWPTILTLTGLILGTSTVTIWSQSAAGVWAGATFILTCGLLGVVILGACSAAVAVARSTSVPLCSAQATCSWHSVDLPGIDHSRATPSSRSSTPCAGGFWSCPGAISPRTSASWKRWSGRSRCAFPTRYRSMTC